jgi:hypothetical protein
MNNHTDHSTPFFSVLTGTLGGVYAFFQNYGLEITDIMELFKVVSFGLIGGACGYAGKFIAMRIHLYLKEKAKKACK